MTVADKRACRRAEKYIEKTHKMFWRVMLNKYGQAEIYEIHEYIKPENEGTLASGGIVFFDNAFDAYIAASTYN